MFWLTRISVGHVRRRLHWWAHPSTTVPVRTPSLGVGLRLLTARPCLYAMHVTSCLPCLHAANIGAGRSSRGPRSGEAFSWAERFIHLDVALFPSFIILCTSCPLTCSATCTACSTLTHRARRPSDAPAAPQGGKRMPRVRGEDWEHICACAPRSRFLTVRSRAVPRL